MKVIGIDPGKNGGIAVREEGLSSCYPMPSTEADIFSLLETLSAPCQPFCYIEKVHSMPGQGSVSVFTFGQGYGFLRGCLTSLRIPFDTVAPRKWQSVLNCLSKGDKNVTKAKAQQLFPHLKVTHKTADAVLIAEYGWRREIGNG